VPAEEYGVPMREKRSNRQTSFIDVLRSLEQRGVGAARATREGVLRGDGIRTMVYSN
jgi:hypothetical protein